jgi:hypothetical protein
MVDSRVFSEEYKYKLFLQWYNKGRPTIKSFWGMVIPDDHGNMPKRTTITTWMKGWKDQAEILDEQIKTRLEGMMIKEKVEMLYRHAELGVKMQNLAVEYIEANKDDLTSATAVRMLVAGVEIERDSRGLPDALEKIMTQSDEKLLDRIKALTKNEPVEITPVK